MSLGRTMVGLKHKILQNSSPYPITFRSDYGRIKTSNITLYDDCRYLRLGRTMVGLKQYLASVLE